MDIVLGEMSVFLFETTRLIWEHQPSKAFFRLNLLLFRVSMPWHPHHPIKVFNENWSLLSM